jgi:PKD repeat protein
MLQKKLAAFTNLFALSLLILLLGAGPLAARDFAPVQNGFDPQGENVLPYAPNRLLIKFTSQGMDKSNLNQSSEKGARVADAKTGLAGVDMLAASVGVNVVERPYNQPGNKSLSTELGVDRWFMFHFDTKRDLEDLAEDFRRDVNVEAVSLDWLALPATVPNDPLHADHWGHNNTAQMVSYDWSTYSHTGPTVGEVGFDANAEAAWDAAQGYGSSNVIIAILDSGVDAGHPDLNQVTGYDYGSNDTNPDDDSSDPGHGTACAGVAASIANNNLGAAGVAGGASIMPCKIADNQGSMYFSYIQNALYGAADNGASIISMSLGAPLSSDSATDAAILYAYNSGCTILAATGNENYSTISYPAINQYVISVGAASPCGDRKRSSSSSTELNPGVTADPNGYTCDGERWWGSNYGTTTRDDRGSVDVIAPTILPTTDIQGSGGYDSGDYSMVFNGTSCATPYAAGVCALIISANPSWTPAQVREQLVGTAQDIINVESGSGWDRYSGYGMVDAAAAVGGGGPVAPTAAFSGSPTSGTFPLNVSFTDGSSGVPTSWSWTFGDGGSSGAQNPSHTYNAVGTYTVSLTVSNSEGNDSVTKTNYITVTEPGVTSFITASGETSVFGTVSGSYANTAVSDGVNETITEELYTGHPRKQYSYAEHQWNFNLPAGGSATFHLEAARGTNSDGDNFVFEYSTDGAIWNALATVSSATKQTFNISLGAISGAVTVRAYDSDRNWYMVSLDDLSVDFMAFELGDVQPVAPAADFAGTPTSGDFPLVVQFTDLSTGDPTSWSWTFGDGGTSTSQNPGHTYSTAGTYTVVLIAANAQGSDTATKTGYITVTEPGTGGSSMHVAAMSVSRIKSGPNYLGVCVVSVLDDGGQAVSGATVQADYDGITSGTVSGTTGSDGTVTLQGSGMKRPSGEWCFEVTNVTHTTLTYDDAANVVTRACESGSVFSADGRNAIPVAFGLEQNHPNPFNPMTTIKFNLPHDSNVVLRVFNVRGQEVQTLVNEGMSAGTHEVTWDARQHPSGIYFYQIEAPGFLETRKMTMLK